MNNEERFREACDKVLSEFHKIILFVRVDQ